MNAQTNNTAEAETTATGEIESTATTNAPVVLMSDDESFGEKALKAIKSAGDGLNGYRATFANFEKAATKVDSIMSKLAELNGGERVNLPIIVAGHGDANTMEGLPDWHESAVAVSILGVKREKATGARALVIYPMPTVDEYMSDSNGSAWLTKVADKETSHVAFRHLRNVDSEAPLEALYQTAQRMPTTIEAYATEAAASGVDYSGFNAVWAELRKKLKEGMPAVAQALPPKLEVVNSIRSASYAKAEYPDLEEQGVFEWLAGVVISMIGLLDDDTLDAGEVEEWKANRESMHIAPKERQKLAGSVDLSSFKL